MNKIIPKFGQRWKYDTYEIIADNIDKTEYFTNKRIRWTVLSSNYEFLFPKGKEINFYIDDKFHYLPNQDKINEE